MKVNAKTKRMLILGAIVLFLLFPLLRMGLSLLTFVGRIVALVFILSLVGRFLSDKGGKQTRPRNRK